ncbi:alpha amylase domain protein [Mycobacterium xenopi 3993]|nr:alpha amylase domain protein [Mycobacterium xenopi 3993]
MDRRQVHHVESHVRDAGSAAAAVANVPCTGLPSSSQPPVERGNISYHAPKRASGRSTQIPNCSPRVTSSRSG